jgi:hypothetical protein
MAAPRTPVRHALPSLVLLMLVAAPGAVPFAGALAGAVAAAAPAVVVDGYGLAAYRCDLVGTGVCLAGRSLDPASLAYRGPPTGCGGALHIAPAIADGGAAVYAVCSDFTTAYRSGIKMGTLVVDAPRLNLSGSGPVVCEGPPGTFAIPLRGSINHGIYGSTTLAMVAVVRAEGACEV